MIVAVIGSRPEYRANLAVSHACLLAAKERDLMRRKSILEFVRSIPESDIIVSVGAPGADTWAIDAAERSGNMRVIMYPAWKTRASRQNLGAGHARNALIAAYADRVVAFIGSGNSIGTANCLDMFAKLNKPAEVRDWTGRVVSAAEFAEMRRAW